MNRPPIFSDVTIQTSYSHTMPGRIQLVTPITAPDFTHCFPEGTSDSTHNSGGWWWMMANNGWWWLVNDDLWWLLMVDDDSWPLDFRRPSCKTISHPTHNGETFWKLLVAGSNGINLAVQSSTKETPPMPVELPSPSMIWPALKLQLEAVSPVRGTDWWLETWAGRWDFSIAMGCGSPAMHRPLWDAYVASRRFTSL